MDREIILSQRDRDILLAHASDELPNESCAILLGKNNRVTKVFLTDNVNRSPVSFAISPEQLLEAYDKAKYTGLDVVGVFHSHPDSKAYPSHTDRRFMRGSSPPMVWIIYSNVHDVLNGYVLKPDDTPAKVNLTCV